MKLIKAGLLSGVLLSIVLMTGRSQQGINYQGELRTPDGTPVESVSDVLFRLYSGIDESDPVWEVHFPNVHISGGHFNVELGTGDAAFQQALVNAKEAYLGIKVGNNPEIQPRQKVTASPYSIQSFRTAEWAIGSIQMSLLTEAQFREVAGTHWVLSDGRAVSGSRWEEIMGSANVPDMRGRFVRMAKGDTSILGSRQEEATAVNGLKVQLKGDHVHQQNVAARKTTGATIINTRADWDSDGNSGVFPQIGVTTESAGDHKHDLTGDAETRPANYVVNYFIKIN